MTHGLKPRVLLPGSGRLFPGAGSDEILLRLATDDADPITVIEDRTLDTEAAPLHSHPWDELVYVLEGEMSFTAGEETAIGGPGRCRFCHAEWRTLSTPRVRRRAS